ncbi:MAG TPA: HlyD family efflux transporter periplasmic adaptor subunit [Polyangiaceae bacterium]|jgi:HlyD family secretion protein|nr:HlyD family efflux transporter periplasmic adaptor subunit [Polyangiaceae bacterium]
MSSASTNVSLRSDAPVESPSPPASPEATRRKAKERRHALARNARHAFLAGLLLAATGAAVMALRPQPVPVDTERAVRGPLVVAIEEDGMTRVKDRFVVSAPVTGSLSRLALEPGDAVDAGDALAEIAPATSPLLDERTRAEAEARLGAALSSLGQARAQVSRAKVAKDLAEQDFARSERLAKNGSIASQALEQADFAVRMRTEELASAAFGAKVAEEQVRVAKVALGRDGAGGHGARHVDVLAPVSGRVLRMHQKSAGVVQASTPLLEVGDPAALEVVVDLLTTDAVHVVPGTPVVVRGWGGDHDIAGRVRRVEPSAFTRPSALGVDEQRVNVIVALIDPYDRWATLADGYRVEARIVLWQGDHVIKVPQGAVFRRGDGWAAFRVESGVARLTSVRLGHRGETEVEIESGLPEGAVVAVHPGDRVKDGVRVEAR